MKTLFEIKAKGISLIDKELLLFRVDSSYFVNAEGKTVEIDENLYDSEDTYDYSWYEMIVDSGLDEPLKPESDIEPIEEIDDVFGNYGFVNKYGDFVIEPQYAYAHEFTHGLAAVNLNRTWYKTEEGRRYYENHFGYIDGNGKTVIGFQYDEAYPFNKYGVAMVVDLNKGPRLIDLEGNVIPGTEFGYISRYWYDDRFLEFSYQSYDEDEESLVGIYDTKERKVLLEPSIDSITEWDEECIKIYDIRGYYGRYDFYQYYINSKGELLYPWLYNKDFAIVEKPDYNNVTAVAEAVFTELPDETRSGYCMHGDKKYERNYKYGLYSSKNEFILPKVYDKIRNIGDEIWACFKDDMIKVIQTEEDD